MQAGKGEDAGDGTRVDEYMSVISFRRARLRSSSGISG